MSGAARAVVLGAALSLALSSCAGAPPPAPAPAPDEAGASGAVEAPPAAPEPSARRAPPRRARGGGVGGERGGERGGVTPEGLGAELRAALKAQGCGESRELFEQMSGVVDRYVEEGAPFLSYLAGLDATEVRVRVQRADLLAEFSSQVLRRHEVLELIARACPEERARLAAYRDRLARRLSGLMGGGRR